MARSIRTALALVLLAGVLAAPAPATPSTSDGMIVSTAWLAERLNDKNLVILQVARQDDFDAGHIPGAQRVDLGQVGRNIPDGLTLELRPLDELTEWARGLGIRKDSRIVIAMGRTTTPGAPTAAARIYLTLDYLGLGNRTALLDGGLHTWIAENRPLSTDPAKVEPSDYTPAPRPEIITVAKWMQENLASPKVTVLDARTANHYTGEGTSSYPRPGHLPGAVNVAFRDVVEGENATFKKKDALQELFRAAGVKPSSRVVTYCHIGQQASLLYFVAKYLGYEAAMYDGSFTEWTALELPVEKPAPGKE